jgi:hypothetical protein
MDFLHFTNWPVSNIDTNTIYCTNWNLSNYWAQKLKGDWLNFVEYLPFDLPNIFIGEANLKEMVSFISKHLVYSSTLLKEYIFEEVRVNKYPELPSRKKCMFLFDLEIDYQQYSKVLKFILEKYNLIVIEPLKGESKFLRVDMNLLNCNLYLYDDIVANAEKYWMGTDKVYLNTEILFEGKFKIKRIILHNF